jgi:surfactin synthase thioesterase subunit
MRPPGEPSAATAAWFASHPRRGSAAPALPPSRARLFLLPYAGGGANVYRDWPQLLPVGLEVLAVQLPGRERRFGEPPITDMNALLDALVPAITPLLDLPFALFGHSMGAAIAHGLALRLAGEGLPVPYLAAVSGRDSPSRPRRWSSLHELPEAEFLAELRRLGGTPPEVLENRELLELMLPLLRADFELVDSYRPAPGAATRLPCPVVVYGGAADSETTPEGLAAWVDCAESGAARVTIFPGGHFFLAEARDALLANLASELRRRLPLGAAGAAPARA